MSKEEILEEIKNIFLRLTEQEPTPDDEIEAKELLIESFKILKNENLIPDQIDLIDEICIKLENWDTLDLWFKEVEGLTENIEKILNLRERDLESEAIEIPSEFQEDTQIESKTEKKPKEIDITEIVTQVSEQFKGEIEGLKETIENLKQELYSKEERIKEISQEPEVQGEVFREPKMQEPEVQEPEIQEEIVQEPDVHEPEIQEETPKPKSKLAPPRIKIPLITKPQKPLKIKVPGESKDEKAEITEIGEKLETPKQQSISQVSLEELKKMLEPIEEPKSTIETQEGLKLTPIITEESSKESTSEIPFKLSLDSIKEQEIDKEKTELESLPIEEPELEHETKEESIITPLPPKKPKLIQTITESLEVPEKSILTSIPFEDSEPSQEVKEVLKPEIKEDITPELLPKEEPKMTPIISEKPKITPINVEEIDTESIKSSGTDLFNVFSSVGMTSPDKSAEPTKSAEPAKFAEPAKSIETLTSKTKKKEPEKKKVYVDLFPETKPAPPAKSEKIDDRTLPKDKDSLYQELIALEGRRYSLEKSYKELNKNYDSGMIDDYEFKNQSDGLKGNLDEISSRIAKIRRLISSL
ncbi:MAG: hypothetical protein ACFE8A_01040 [Candidatus Hodarchaeota archaeon]